MTKLHFIYLLIHGWAPGCFHLRVTINNATINICVQVFGGRLCLFLLDTYLGSESLGHMLTQHLLFELPPDFSTAAALFHMPTSHALGFQGLFFLANAVICLTLFLQMGPGGRLPGEERGLAPGACAWGCDFEGSLGPPRPPPITAESSPGSWGEAPGSGTGCTSHCRSHHQTRLSLHPQPQAAGLPWKQLFLAVSAPGRSSGRWKG